MKKSLPKCSYSLFILLLISIMSPVANAQVIFSDDFERDSLGDQWDADPYAQWSIVAGKAYNSIDGSGGKMATSESFSATNYTIETIAYPFEYGYWREYYLTFGEQSTPDSSYAIRYDAAYGGVLQIIKSTDNIYYGEVLSSVQSSLNDSVPLQIKVERFSNGIINLYISEVGNPYPETPILEANDNTYTNIGKLGWHITTQTAAQDFYVESIQAEVISASYIFEDDFERDSIGNFWLDEGRWTIVNGEAYNSPDNNGSLLTTAQSFSESTYILETQASDFVTGYYREYFFLFGQQDTLGNYAYVINYDPDFGEVLSLGISNGNYYYPDVIDDKIVNIDPSKAYGLRVARYNSGLIQVYLGDENGFPEEPTLEAIDTTYQTLGRVSWGNATQTAGEDFFVEYISARVPDEQKTTPEKPIEDDLIKQVITTSSNSYEIGKLLSGETFFTDRTYTITTVPDFLEGASFIKTSNSDKNLTTASDFLKAYLKESALAYVGYDPRATQLPQWLSSWTKTDLTIGTTDPGSVYYEVYTKPVDSYIFETYPIQLRIGANLASPAVGSQMNYIVGFVAVPNNERLEAEEATLSGAQVASNHSGFSGSGFVDYVNASNDYIEWNVNIAATSPYELSFRYSNGGSSNRNLLVSVDGVATDTLLGTSTSANWTSWRSESIDVLWLEAGDHLVRLTAMGNSGPNVDYLRVAPSDETPTNSGSRIASQTKSEELNPLNVTVYPNPIISNLNIEIPNDLGESKFSLRVVDLSGRIFYSEQYQKSANRNEEMVLSIPASQWKSGVYLLEITSGSKTHSYKLIKSK